MAVTLTNLTDRAKQVADLVGSAFISSSEWTTYINNGLKELYDLVVAANEDYFTTSGTVTISAAASSASMPATFYKLRGVDYQLSSSDYINVPLFSFQDRNRSGEYLTSSQGNDPTRRYRIILDSLHVTPADKAPGSYRVWYVPSVTELSSGSDTISTTFSKFGWEEYIVLYAAIKALTKQEQDVRELNNQKAELAQRIITMSTSRNSDQPERITNLSQTSRYGDWPHD
jgi:hypothetical protein